MIQDPEIPPALSLDEWMEFGESREVLQKLALGQRPFGPIRRFTDEQKLHAVAALALHRHPAAFTRAEVEALCTAAYFYENRGYPDDSEIAASLRSAHDKIAALTPPPEVKLPLP